MNKIGFLDSGIGGLTVLESCFHQWQINSESSVIKGDGRIEIDEIIYLADTANLPYGDKSLPELKQILLDNLRWFAEKEITYLVLACNTSSVLLDSQMRQNFAQSQIQKFEIITLLDSLTLKIQAEYKHLKNICIISTQATHQTGAYIKSLKEILPSDANIFSIPCPKLVPLIEVSIAEELSLEELLLKAQSVVAEYCALIPDDCEALVFGCSHYPLLQQAFGEFLPNTILLNPADALAERVDNIKLKGDFSQNMLLKDSIKTESVKYGRTIWQAFSTGERKGLERKLNSLNGVFDCVQYFGNKVRNTQHFTNAIKS